jgi:GT2 family glycosyltransferase
MYDPEMTDTDPWGRITVVLVTRNSSAIIPISLGSLEKAKRIILIDALSTDDTVEVAKTFANVEVIRLTEDRGWGAGTNQGFALADTEYVLNINPDTKLPEGCVEQMIQTADANPGVAIVAPLLSNARGDMDLGVMGPGERHHRELKDPPAGPFCTWFVTGAVVIWRLSAFRDVGGFDENIFLYNEDTDIAYRATQKGYSLILDPAAKCDHFGGHSEEISLKARIRRDQNMAWGHLYYERKWGAPGEAEDAARKLLKKSLGEAFLGFLTIRPRKTLTNFAKARVAYSFLLGGAMWGRS